MNGQIVHTRLCALLDATAVVLILIAAPAVRAAEGDADGPSDQLDVIVVTADERDALALVRR